MFMWTSLCVGRLKDISIILIVLFFQTKINIHGIYNTLTYHKRHSVDVKLASRQTESYRKKKAKRQFVKDDYCLFLSNQYKVKSCAWKFFNKNIKLVDFTKPEETVKTMNEWVSNQTGNTDVSLEPNYFDNYTHILFVSDERCYIVCILRIFIMFLKGNNTWLLFSNPKWWSELGLSAFI